MYIYIYIFFIKHNILIYFNFREVYCNQFSGQLIIPKNCNLKEL